MRVRIRLSGQAIFARDKIWEPIFDRLIAMPRGRPETRQNAS